MYLCTFIFLGTFTGCATWDGMQDDSKEAWETTKEVSSEAWDKTKEVSSEAWENTKKSTK